MKLSRGNLPALALLLAVLVVNAVGLLPELSISRVEVNDKVLHFTLAERWCKPWSAAKIRWIACRRNGR